MLMLSLDNAHKPGPVLNTGITNMNEENMHSRPARPMKKESAFNEK